MDPEKLECIFYRTGSGEEPVRHWLKKLKQEDSAAVRVIGADLDRVQWQWPISMPLVGSLGDGLYEVRSSVGRGEYRLIFCVPRRQLVVLMVSRRKRGRHRRLTVIWRCDARRRSTHEQQTPRLHASLVLGGGGAPR